MTDYLESKITDLRWNIQYHEEKLENYKKELELVEKLKAMEAA